MTEIKSYSSGDIKSLLSLRYAAPEYAFFTEVANSTGAQGVGYADGVSYGLYPSAGHPIYGFEIKVSRSDWLRELKQPGKAGNVMQYCDKWWLVAPKGVAHVEEIPKLWGFLEIINDRFYTRKHAPDLTPIPPTPSFIAAMLRRATENTVPKSTVTARVNAAWDDIKKSFADRIDRAEKDRDDYMKRVHEWEKASGLSVFGGSPEKSRELGQVVAWVLKGGLRRSMVYSTEEAMRQVTKILENLQEFEKLHKGFPSLPPEIKPLTSARWDIEKE